MPSDTSTAWGSCLHQLQAQQIYSVQVRMSSPNTQSHRLTLVLSPEQSCFLAPQCHGN